MANHTPLQRSWVKRFFSLAGWLHYWFILVAVLLVALVKGLVEPLLLEPLAKHNLLAASDRLTQRMGESVEISFDEIHFSFGLKGLYLIVTEPSISISGRSVYASEASLLVRPNQQPLLLLRKARLAFEYDEDGNLSLIGIPVSRIESILGEDVQATQGVPSSFVAVDTDVSFKFSDGSRLELPPITAAVKPELDSRMLVMSLSSGIDDPLRFSGRLNMPLDNPDGRAEFYLSATGIEHVLQVLGIKTKIESGRIHAWGNRDANGTIEALVLGNANSLSHQLDLEKEGVADSPTIPDSILDAASVRFAASVIAKSADDMELTWSAAANGINLSLPDKMLGAPLLLSSLETGGEASFKNGILAIKADNTRFVGGVGTGSAAIELQTDFEESINVAVNGSAPVMDVATVTNLLPLSLSERGVPFLRNDLSVERAQLVTLVLYGSDFESFPWKDEESQVFRMNVDFFNASLDYAEGYPLLENAVGGFGLDGPALAVTVASATSDKAVIDIARAGVDDLDAAVSTLFVALDASLPEGAMESLLLAVPATRDEARPLLEALRPQGEQSLRLALVINLDEDVPVGFDGALVVDSENSVTHAPSGLSIESMAGAFGFSNDGVSGVATGKLLDRDVRLSVSMADDTRSLRLEGNFDISEAAHMMGREMPVPLEGSSPVLLVVDDSGLYLESNLSGTEVKLPRPFGKDADTLRTTVLRVAGNTYRLEYGNDFVKAVGNLGDDAIAVSIGGEAPPEVPATSGIEIGGRITGLDADAFIAELTVGAGTPSLGLSADLELADVTLLGQSHPTLSFAATIASTLTVAFFEADAIGGMLTMQGPTVAVSLGRLHLPENDEDPSKLGADATIYVEPGVLTAELPDISLWIDDLMIGEKRYQSLSLSGHPENGVWVMDGLVAKVGDNIVTANGTTNTKGEPYSNVSLAVEMPDLPGFFANYSANGSQDSILEGNGRIVGEISWKGALYDPHALSMEGSLDISGNNVVISEDSSGARLLSLLSPFTILQTLPDLRLGEGRTQFDSATGSVSLAGGELMVDEILLESVDLNLRITGKTNMITERNNLRGVAVIKSSDNITTGAVTFVNPIAGALLLVFDKVLEAPLIGDLEMQYIVSGTWDEPEVTLGTVDGLVGN